MAQNPSADISEDIIELVDIVEDDKARTSKGGGVIDFDSALSDLRSGEEDTEPSTPGLDDLLADLDASSGNKEDTESEQDSSAELDPSRPDLSEAPSFESLFAGLDMSDEPKDEVVLPEPANDPILDDLTSLIEETSTPTPQPDNTQDDISSGLKDVDDLIKSLDVPESGESVAKAPADAKEAQELLTGLNTAGASSDLDSLLDTLFLNDTPPAQKAGPSPSLGQPEDISEADLDDLLTSIEVESNKFSTVAELASEPISEPVSAPVVEPVVVAEPTLQAPLEETPQQQAEQEPLVDLPDAPQEQTKQAEQSVEQDVKADAQLAAKYSIMQQALEERLDKLEQTIAETPKVDEQLEAKYEALQKTLEARMEKLEQALAHAPKVDEQLNAKYNSLQSALEERLSTVEESLAQVSPSVSTQIDDKYNALQASLEERLVKLEESVAQIPKANEQIDSKYNVLQQALQRRLFKLEQAVRAYSSKADENIEAKCSALQQSLEERLGKLEQAASQPAEERIKPLLELMRADIEREAAAAAAKVLREEIAALLQGN